jgi:hypothetical protein
MVRRVAAAMVREELGTPSVVDTGNVGNSTRTQKRFVTWPGKKKPSLETFCPLPAPAASWAS